MHVFQVLLGILIFTDFLLLFSCFKSNSMRSKWNAKLSTICKYKGNMILWRKIGRQEYIGRYMQRQMSARILENDYSENFVNFLGKKIKPVALIKVKSTTDAFFEHLSNFRNNYSVNTCRGTQNTVKSC